VEAQCMSYKYSGPVEDQQYDNHCIKAKACWTSVTFMSCWELVIEN